MNDKYEQIYNSPTAYDDAFKTLLNDCSCLIIPLINEVFGTHFSMQDKVTFKNNEHFLSVEGVQRRIETDSEFYIGNDENRRFHIECQSTPDSKMLVRMFEYDMQAALDSGTVTGNRLTVNIPHSAILYLRSNDNTPDNLVVEINAPGGSLVYIIPAIKMIDYDLDSIYERELYFLLPFYIFNEEREFNIYERDAGKLEEFKHRLVRLFSQLNVCVKRGLLGAFEEQTIIYLINMVAKKLTMHNYNVREAIRFMGGRVIEDYPAKRILKRGLEQGLEQGKIITYINLYKDGMITIEYVADKLNMTEAEVDELIDKYDTTGEV
ncbi:MAG: hypothetical protein K6F92_06290 [Lachnospiraceae bacterium]|nr:hypothetical protein [Lachnospiraceae bacterium]